MNYLTAKIQKPTPWNLLYADDVVLISENLQNLQEGLEKWRQSLEFNGLRISRTKTVDMAEDGSIEADVIQRTTSGWTKWRMLTGVQCNSKMPIRTKGKVYKTAVRSSLLYGSEVWADEKVHEEMANEQKCGC